MKKEVKNLVDNIIIKPLFFILAICTIGLIYTPTNYKWYRKWLGGIWYEYSPKMFLYMTFYTQNKESIYEHEIIFNVEDYNIYDKDLIDDFK